MPEKELREKLEAVLDSYQYQREGLLPALKVVQDETGHLDPTCICFLSKRLRIPESTIYGTGTFYSLHTTEKLGRYTVRVCNSIVCHSQSGKELLDYIEKRLSVKPGETTADGLFSLEEAACLGACDRSPVIMVNETTYYRVTPEYFEEIITNLQPESEIADNGGECR